MYSLCRAVQPSLTELSGLCCHCSSRCKLKAKIQSVPGWTQILYAFMPYFAGFLRIVCFEAQSPVKSDEGFIYRYGTPGCEDCAECLSN